jgi:hypothetical protein
MRAALEINRCRLSDLRARVQRDAEAQARSKELPHTFGRHSTSWTKAHEAAFQHRLVVGLEKHGNEIGALEAKIARQEAAIRARHLKKARKARPS